MSVIMDQNLSQEIFTIPPGKVRCWNCSNIRYVLSAIEKENRNLLNNHKIVFKNWEILPPHEILLNDLLKTLAQVAYEFWPYWFSLENPEKVLKNYGDDEAIRLDLVFKQVVGSRGTLSIPWCRAVLARCQKNQIPLLNDFSLEIQIEQLSLAIEPVNFSLIVVFDELHPDDKRLSSLARSVTWFAQKTGARVVVLLNRNMAYSSALEIIMYDSFSVQDEHTIQHEKYPQEKRHILTPLVGHPNPDSPGEQLLAEKLKMDTELKGLFQFNLRVNTVKQHNFLVDLLWEEGKVIVEVDGFKYHGDQYSFSHDRQRDYELLISGYKVLRLTHDEVMSDVWLSIEKIRDIVRYQKA